MTAFLAGRAGSWDVCPVTSQPSVIPVSSSTVCDCGWLPSFCGLMVVSHPFAVTNYNNGLEASSDSDDEDKLHIVEEDSLQEPEATAAAEGPPLQDSHTAATVLPHNGVNGGTSRRRSRPQPHNVLICSGVTFDQGFRESAHPVVKEKKHSNPGWEGGVGEAGAQ